MERPVVTCPDWCAVEPDQHVEELTTFDGGVLHVGRWRSLVAEGPMEAQFLAATLVDGTPDPDDQDVRVRISVMRDDPMKVTQAMAAAGRLIRLIHEVVDDSGALGTPS